MLGLVAGSTAVLATPAFAADPLTVTPSRGPSGGGNTISLTTTGNDFSGTPGIIFSAAACANTWPASVAPTGSGTSLTAGVVRADPGAATIASGNAKQLNVVVPAALALTATQTSSTWYVCVYASHGGASAGAGIALAANTSAAVYTISPALTLSQTSGLSGAGNTVTATVSQGSLSASTTVQFQYVGTGANAGCAPTYQTPAAPAVTNGVQTAGAITVPSANVSLVSGQNNRLSIVLPNTLALTGGQATAPYSVCAYNGTSVSSSLVAVANTSYTVAGLPITLNTYAGPSGGGNSITATSTATFTPGVTAQFQYQGTGAAAACAPTYRTVAAAAATAGVQTAGVHVGEVRILTPNKIAITAPAALALASGLTSAEYNVCVYSGSTVGTSTLVGGTTQPYIIAEPATITNITPSKGSAQGGTTITVTGTNFPQTLTATINGIPVTDIQVAANGQSFTALAPPQAVGGPYPVTITTNAGTITRPAAFTYSNGLSITPNFAPSNRLAGTEINVLGTGFLGMTFGGTGGGTPRTADAHVYLVNGIYDPTIVNTDEKTNGEVAECVDVLVISNNELVCKLNVATSLDEDGAYDTTSDTRTGLAISTTSGSDMITAGVGTTFSAADVGLPISVPSDTEFVTGTMITAVIDSTHAVISNNAIATGTPNATIGPRGLAEDVDLAVGSTTVQGVANDFLSSDVGKLVTGTGIAPGTVITAVGATTATLSRPALSNQTDVDLTILPSVPVPDGTYTLTVVNSGAIGAQAISTFNMSVVSNGSTFTVADY